MVLSAGIPLGITEQVLKVCRQIDEGETPYYVAVKPDPGSRQEECFFNVKTKVERDGGSIKFGWALWEWADVMIWADFHAIWISPEDEHVDITPTPGFERMLFLPDSGKEYDYTRPYYREPLRYFPVSDNPLVLELIAAKQQLFAIEQEHSTGRMIELEGSELARYEALKQEEGIIALRLMSQLQPPSNYGRPGRNDPCPCGSGKKYKKCHGREWTATYYVA